MIGALKCLTLVYDDQPFAYELEKYAFDNGYDHWEMNYSSLDGKWKVTFYGVE